MLGGDATTWYYVTPDGSFYRWEGGGVSNRTLLAHLDPASYEDPALIYDAQAGVVPPAVVTVSGNTLTLDPNNDFVGTFAAEVTVSDGSLTDTLLIPVDVLPNEGPTLTDPGNQTIPTTQDLLTVTLEATDPEDGTIVYSAELQTAEYYLDQTIGIDLGPDLFENWSGTQNEKWLLGDEGSTWYFILPDGSFRQWLGGHGRDIIDRSVEIATLSPATYDNPALLYDAQPGQPVPAVASVDGNVLTVDPNEGFIGAFSVQVTATDSGGLTDSSLILVTVTPPPAAPAFFPVADATQTPEAADEVGRSELVAVPLLPPQPEVVESGRDSQDREDLDAVFSDDELASLAAGLPDEVLTVLAAGLRSE